MTVTSFSFLEPLPDAEQMRATDRWAIEEQGIASLELMERAGRGLAGLVAEVVPDGRIAVVCGRGNNGGDGYVAARVLRESGREVDVLHVGGLELRGDALANLERLPGEPPRPFSAGALDGAAGAVDALLGTGTAGPPRDGFAAAIEALNARDIPVVAADVPSGVDASTGEVEGPAVRAAATATFAAAKPGLWIAPGKGYAGEIRVIDIGIPAGAPVEPSVGLIGEGALSSYPRRGGDSTKFASGHVLVAGGSRGLTGAVCLAAEAAMRAGAGYVTACVPAELEAIFEVKLTEVMTVGLPAGAGADVVVERAEQRGGALVLGPGAGREEAALEQVREIARRAPTALVLDADGLNAHAERLATFTSRAAPTILTPHAGELGRLLGVDSAAVGARRLHHARAAAQQAGAIVVLKGDDTLVAEPEGRVAVSPGGSPALATAGTGDVLSGILGAFLARGMEPFVAACAAVQVHAEAGRRAAILLDGPDGVIARDVIDELPHALG